MRADVDDALDRLNVARDARHGARHMNNRDGDEREGDEQLALHRVEGAGCR